MPEKIGEFDRLGTGIHPSLPNDKVPIWSDGRNVVFGEESVQPLPGQTSFFQKLDNDLVLGAVEHFVAGKPNAFWGTAKHLHRFIEGDSIALPATRTPVTTQVLYTGIDDETATQAQSRWSFTRFGTWLMASNGVDTPQIWKPTVIAPVTDNWPQPTPDGSTEFADWVQDPSGSPTALPFTTAELLGTLGPYVVAFNTSNDRDRAEWSDTDDAETWTPTATNAAGDLAVRQLNGELIAVVPIGRDLLLWGQDQGFLFEFIGAPFYFGVREVVSGIGAVGKHSVARVGTTHFGFGQRGIWMFAGGRHTAIDDPSVHDFVYQNLNTEQLSKVVAWPDTTQGIVFFSYPQSGDLNNSITLGYHYLESQKASAHIWGLYTIARSAATDGSVFGHTLLLNANGDVFKQNIIAGGINADLPMTMVATSTVTSGYGELGYGELGYGGSQIDVG